MTEMKCEKCGDTTFMSPWKTVKHFWGETHDVKICLLCQKIEDHIKREQEIHPLEDK